MMGRGVRIAFAAWFVLLCQKLDLCSGRLCRHRAHNVSCFPCSLGNISIFNIAPGSGGAQAAGESLPSRER